MPKKKVTGSQIGLSGEDQIRIGLKTILKQGGEASMSDIYSAVERELGGNELSNQGKASLRYFINTTAVRAGFVYPYDKNSPSWKITPEGREYIEAYPPSEEDVVNVDTGKTEKAVSNTVRGAEFEKSILMLLQKMYPHYTWYHQGKHKKNERGIDFIGNPIGETMFERPTIGVQVKLHKPNSAPTETEWLKFLAGCFVRKLDQAIFVTTGRLTGNQRREAGEGGITVIEGIENLLDLSETFSIDINIYNDLFSQYE